MTAAELLSDAHRRANKSSPQIRKAALLWIARAQSLLSPESAGTTLNESLSLDQGPPDRHENLGFEEQTWLVAAAIAPQRLKDLPRMSARGRRHLVGRLAMVMQDHGQQRHLRAYILESPLTEIHMDGIGVAMAHASTADERAALLRRAIEIWRAPQTDSQFHDPFAPHRFISLFRHHWQILPRPEAASILNEILDDISQKPDTTTTARIMEAEFSSMRAVQLFEIYAVAHELEPERAQSFVKKYRELARALKRYPAAHKTIDEEHAAERAKAPPPDPNAKPGYIIGGSGKDDINRGMALLNARQNGNFTQPLRNAARTYNEDANPASPNLAPKPFWPSASEYRSLFHSMGKRLGESAQEKLKLIRDDDIRLFAQIELVAAMSGLPELPSMRQSRH